MSDMTGFFMAEKTFRLAALGGADFWTGLT